MKNINNLNSHTIDMAQIGIFSAIIIILSLTPLGYIPLGVVSITIIHIPVIIGSITMNLRSGVILGMVMGIFSLIRATVMPSTPMDVLFLNPLISVLPRVCIGIVSSLVFLSMKRILKDKKYSLHISIGTAALMGTLTNTILVLSLLYVLYYDKLAIETTNVVSFVLGSIFAVNGLVEILLSVILSIPISLSILKLEKRV